MPLLESETGLRRVLLATIGLIAAGAAAPGALRAGEMIVLGQPNYVPQLPAGLTQFDMGMIPFSSLAMQFPQANYAQYGNLICYFNFVNPAVHDICTTMAAAQWDAVPPPDSMDIIPMVVGVMAPRIIPGPVITPMPVQDPAPGPAPAHDPAPKPVTDPPGPPTGVVPVVIAPVIPPAGDPPPVVIPEPATLLPSCLIAGWLAAGFGIRRLRASTY